MSIENVTYLDLDVDYSTAKDDAWYRAIIPADDFENNGTSVRVQIKAHSTSNCVVTGCSTGEQDGVNPEDYSEAPTRLTFDSGNDGKTISAGTTAWTDWIAYNWIATNAHLVHVNIDDIAGTYYVKRRNSYKSGVELNQNQGDQTLTQDVTGVPSSHFYCVQAIEIEYGTTREINKLESTTEDEYLKMLLTLDIKARR